MQSIYFGLMLVISNSSSMYGFPAGFSGFMNGTVAGVLPVGAIIALVAAAILWFVTSRTKVGRNLYALGGNREAAWYSGINVHVLGYRRGFCVPDGNRRGRKRGDAR